MIDSFRKILWVFAIAALCAAACSKKTIEPHPRSPSSEESDGSTHVPSGPGAETTTKEPTHQTFQGEGFNLWLPAGEWKVDLKADPRVYPAGASAGIEGPMRCRGAVVGTRQLPKEGMQAAATRIAAGLGLQKVTMIYENPLLYGGKTAYQYNLRGLRDGQTVRVQGTLKLDGGWWVEIRGWSPLELTLARHCHDKITAGFNDEGLAAVLTKTAGAAPGEPK